MYTMDYPNFIVSHQKEELLTIQIVNEHKMANIFFNIRLNVCFGRAKEPFTDTVVWVSPTYVLFRNRNENFQVRTLIWRPNRVR